VNGARATRAPRRGATAGTPGGTLRVLLVAPFPPPTGGIARWATIVTDDLAGSDAVSLRCVSSSPPVSLSKPKRTPLERLLAGALGTPRLLVRTAGVLRTQRPRVLHIATSGGPGHLRDLAVMALGKLVGARAVLHLHHGRLGGAPSRSERLLASAALALSAGAICLDERTEATVERLAQRLPGRRVIRRIPNPVPFELPPVPADQRSRSLVFVGWNLASKGLDDLLAAWQGLGPATEPYVLAVVGPGANDYRAGRSAPLPARVELLGEKPHPETLDLIREATALVLPSHSEGFPNVVLEAMAAATPVVATRVGAIPEMLRDDGRLVDAKDRDGLAEAIGALLADPEDAFVRAERSRRRGESLYSVPAVSRQLTDLWGELAQNPTRLGVKSPSSPRSGDS
jgi:glycosyltransferase involved in cell wall biosynthesis